MADEALTTETASLFREIDESFPSDVGRMDIKFDMGTRKKKSKNLHEAYLVFSYIALVTN